MDIKELLLRWFINFWIKKTSIENENISNKELAEELHKQLKILIKEKYTHISKTIFGVQIKQICNW